jgi:hypothetical protein
MRNHLRTERHPEKQNKIKTKITLFPELQTIPDSYV